MERRKEGEGMRRMEGGGVLNGELGVHKDQCHGHREQRHPAGHPLQMRSDAHSVNKRNRTHTVRQYHTT